MKDASSYGSDKSENPHYLRNYEEFFEPFIGKEVKLLELGVGKGGSLLMWRDYFDRGTIVGLNINPVHVDDSTGRIRVYLGRQENTALLSRIAQEQAPDGFDIIIDDCSHIGELTRISFWHLFEHHLKPGGIYAIEDWGTGYWVWYADGHNYQPIRQSALTRLAACLHKSARSLAEHPLAARLPRLPSFLRRHAYEKRLVSHDYGMVVSSSSWWTSAAWET
jgi:hypothetical protein